MINMKNVVSDIFIEEVIKNNYAMGMEGIWFDIYYNLTEDLNNAKEIFLYVISVLLNQGKVRLADNGIFLTGTLEDQIQTFRDKWPSWDKFDADMFYITKPYQKDGKTMADFWIPGGLVWIDPDDGSYLWT